MLKDGDELMYEGRVMELVRRGVLANDQRADGQQERPDEVAVCKRGTGRVIDFRGGEASRRCDLAAVTLVGMFWISCRMDRELALVSLAVVPFLYYSVGYYATHIQDRIKRVSGLEMEALSVVHESISMMRVIAAFGREDHEHRRLREHTSNAVAARVKVTVHQTLFSLAVNMITAIGSTLVLGLGAYHVMQGRLTVGQMLVVISYIAAVFKPLETIRYTLGSPQSPFVNLQNTLTLFET